MNESIEMQGQICLVTGANSGIGKTTSLGLAKLGATVVMVCRNEERGQAARADIMEKSGSTSVDLLVADLSSHSAIRQLAKAFAVKYPRLHVLINNAGINLSTCSKTVDGIETTFAVNYLAPFLLTNSLLEVLKASAPARIVNIMGHAGKLNFDDLMNERQYNGMQAYQQSKTAILLFTVELARRLDGTGVTANIADPGFVKTNLGRDARGLFRAFLTVIRPFMLGPEKGAETPIYVASAPEMEGVNGKLFANTKEQALPLYDQSDAQRLWQVSTELTRLIV